MLFAVLRRNARANEYALSPSGAVAALARLREQTLPSLVNIPYFNQRAQATVANPTWAGQAARQAFFATLFAAFVLVTAISVPAILSSRGGDSASASALHSSIGVTGTSDTLVEDLNISTFVGGVPFVQQLQYYDAVTSSTPLVQRFVAGAREAGLVAYVQNVGQQVTLPYLSDAVTTKRAIDAWNGAVAQAQVEADRQAQLREAAAIPPASQAWQAPPIPIGTKLQSTTTFYACHGDPGQFCGTMASGQQVFSGAAACSNNMPFGTKFRVDSDPSGSVFTCLDRGALTATWVDVWFYDAADAWGYQQLGLSNTITIVG